MTYTYISCSGKLILSATTNQNDFTICGTNPWSSNPNKLIPTIGNPCVNNVCVTNYCTNWKIKNNMNNTVKIYYNPCCGSTETEYVLSIGEIYIFSSFGPPYSYTPSNPNVTLTLLGDCN
jgi:hypothetical protein